MYHILWVTADRGAVGSYRCYTPAYGLKDAGLADSTFVFHDQVTTSNVQAELRGMDIAVFQRLVCVEGLSWMKEARKAGVSVVFEMDDDLFDVPRHNPAGWLWWKKETQRMLRQQLEFCDLVVTSTLPLAQTVQTKMGWKTREKIRVCPNHLHPAIWGKHRWATQDLVDNKGQVVIGWQGSATHDKDFREALPALKRLVKEYPEVTLRFFGNVPYSVKGEIPPDRFEWMRGTQFDVYPQALRHAHFDIGLAPITSSAFNQSKSNLKFLEYSALDIPCVASRVYPYAKTITDGVNGFLASGPDEWYERLKTLIRSPALREWMGQNAFYHVWEHHSSQTHVPLWDQAFTQLREAYVERI